MQSNLFELLRCGGGKDSKNLKGRGPTKWGGPAEDIRLNRLYQNILFIIKAEVGSKALGDVVRNIEA